MTTNDAVDRSLEEFISYAEEVVGGRLTEWQRATLVDFYDRNGAIEGHGYVAKADREYDKVDAELSDLVDEFLSSPVKGEPVALDLGDLVDEVCTALDEAGVPVRHGHN